MHGTIQQTLTYTVIYNPELLDRFYCTICRRQHPVAPLVDDAETVKTVVMHNAEVVVEHIAFHSRYIRNLRVDHHLSRGIDKLNPTAIIHRSYSIGEYPRMLILRFDDRLAGKHIEIATLLPIAITNQRV